MSRRIGKYNPRRNAVTPHKLDTLTRELQHATAQAKARREAAEASKPRPSIRAMCAGCDHVRICTDHNKTWLCVDCAPAPEQKR